MGCAQTSGSVIPPNHIPIESLYVNENYQMMRSPPVIMITAPPTPAYVKSVLKKTYPDERGRTERIPFLNRKLPSLNKSVNFDEQVLVKARTPTPSKIWYEKSTSTMPMRKHPRNDDDDHDYDDEEIRSVSSDEELEKDEQIDTEPQIPTLGPPTSLLQRNQANTFWHKTNSIGLMPSTNRILENESLSSTLQQPSLNMNTYATENPITPSVNRIKVRRRLSLLGPPQIAPELSYESPPQSSIISSYQSLTRASTVPAYQNPAQTSIVSPYQSTVQPLTLPSYQTPIQPSYVQRTLPNTNSVLIEHRPTLTNGEPLAQTAYYAFNRHPIENVT